MFELIWSELLGELDVIGKIDWKEAAADAWFARAKKGAIAWEKPSAAKEPKPWMSFGGHGTPIAGYVASASKSGVNLIEPTLD